MNSSYLSFSLKNPIFKPLPVKTLQRLYIPATPPNIKNIIPKKSIYLHERSSKNSSDLSSTEDVIQEVFDDYKKKKMELVELKSNFISNEIIQFENKELKELINDYVSSSDKILAKIIVDHESPYLKSIIIVQLYIILDLPSCTFIGNK